MFPHEIYVEIFGFLEYGKQGPIRCTCKKLSIVPLTYEQACSEPCIPEIVHFLFRELELVKWKGEARKSCLFKSIIKMYYHVRKLCFTNDIYTSCITLHGHINTVVYYQKGYFSQSNVVEFKTKEELIGLLAGYKLDLSGMNSKAIRFFRLLCKQRLFHNYDTDKFCVQTLISRFKALSYSDSCRKQSAFLEVMDLFVYDTQAKIQNMVADVYGHDEYELTFDCDNIPGHKFDEIVIFVLNIIEKFGSQEYTWLILK